MNSEIYQCFTSQKKKKIFWSIIFAHFFLMWENARYIKVVIFTILSVQCRGINYIPNVVQPSLLPISNIFSSLPKKFCIH